MKPHTTRFKNALLSFMSHYKTLLKAQARRDSSIPDVFFCSGVCINSIFCTKFDSQTNTLCCDTENVELPGTLKLTASSHLKMDGWKMNFLLGFGLVSGAMLVLGRVFIEIAPIIALSGSPNSLRLFYCLITNPLLRKKLLLKFPDHQPTKSH